MQNYPNPFNPSTMIKFTIPKTETVKLQVYNTLGQIVKTLIEDKLQTGSYGKCYSHGGLTGGHCICFAVGDFADEPAYEAA